MGKHDVRTMTSSEEYMQNRIKDLEARIAFVNETNCKLKEELSKYNKWVSEIEAAAEKKITELEAENAKLKGKIVRLVERYV